MINTIYDANVWSKLSYEDLAYWMAKSHNYLVNDTAVELYIGSQKHNRNEKFLQKLSLAFNSSWGLRDEFTLVLFEVPWKQPVIYENSANTVNPKNDAFSCSLYHYWLRYAISPAIIMEPLICQNSALTMELIKNNDPAKIQEIEKEKNRSRQAMLRKTNRLFKNSVINVKTLIGSWRKRDDSIKNDLLKLADYREVLFALIKIVSSRESVVILTADYDIVDIQNNLYLSIIDQYVIQKILLEKIEQGFAIEEEPKLLMVDNQFFQETVKKTHEKIMAENEHATLCVMLYSDKDGKLYPFENKFPSWLLKFLYDYRGNANCLSMPYNPQNIYQIRYTWEMESLYSTEGLKFNVWYDAHTDEKLLSLPMPTVLSKMSKEELNKEKNKALFPMWCKPLCRFEREEYNNPKSLSPFIDD